jgi:hypothetical protein
MNEILLLYKSPALERMEIVTAYIAGVSVVAALRHFTDLPHPVTAAGFLATFLAVLILDTWRLRHSGTMLPAAEVNKRRSQYFARRSTILSIAETTGAFVILVGTISLIMSDGTFSAALADYLQLPWLLAFLLAGGIYVGWRKTRRENRFAQQNKFKGTASLPERIARWRGAFDVFAAVSIGIGILSALSFYFRPPPVALHSLLFTTDGAVLATIAGIVSGLTVLILVRMGTKVKPTSKNAGFMSALRSGAIMGVLFWGVPMAIFFVALESIAVVVISTSATLHLPATIGASLTARSYTESLLLLPQLLSLTFGIAVPSGLAFGLLLAPSLWALMRLSLRVGGGHQPTGKDMRAQ